MSCNVNRKMYTCGAGILESICIDIDTETYIHKQIFHLHCDMEKPCVIDGFLEINSCIFLKIISR